MYQIIKAVKIFINTIYNLVYKIKTDYKYTYTCVSLIYQIFFLENKEFQRTLKVKIKVKFRERYLKFCIRTNKMKSLNV